MSILDITPVTLRYLPRTNNVHRRFGKHERFVFVFSLIVTITRLRIQRKSRSDRRRRRLKRFGTFGRKASVCTESANKTIE